MAENRSSLRVLAENASAKWGWSFDEFVEMTVQSAERSTELILANMGIQVSYTECIKTAQEQEPEAFKKASCKRGWCELPVIGCLFDWLGFRRDWTILMQRYLLNKVLELGKEAIEGDG